MYLLSYFLSPFVKDYSVARIPTSRRLPSLSPTRPSRDVVPMTDIATLRPRSTSPTSKPRPRRCNKLPPTIPEKYWLPPSPLRSLLRTILTNNIDITRPSVRLFVKSATDDCDPHCCADYYSSLSLLLSFFANQSHNKNIAYLLLVDEWLHGIHPSTVVCKNNYFYIHSYHNIHDTMRRVGLAMRMLRKSRWSLASPHRRERSEWTAVAGCWRRRRRRPACRSL